jgi:hypothetical protein
MIIINPAPINKNVLGGSRINTTPVPGTNINTTLKITKTIQIGTIWLMDVRFQVNGETISMGQNAKRVGNITWRIDSTLMPKSMSLPSFYKSA